MSAMVPFAAATMACVVYPALTAPQAHNGFWPHCLPSCVEPSRERALRLIVRFVRLCPIALHRASHMMQQSRRQLLIKAVQDAAIELAAKANRAKYAPAFPDNKKPTPDEISAAAAACKGATGRTYLDNTDEDELWVAYAINTRQPTCGPRPHNG